MCLLHMGRDEHNTCSVVSTSTESLYKKFAAICLLEKFNRLETKK